MTSVYDLIRSTVRVVSPPANIPYHQEISEDLSVKVIEMLTREVRQIISEIFSPIVQPMAEEIINEINS